MLAHQSVTYMLDAAVRREHSLFTSHTFCHTNISCFLIPKDNISCVCPSACVLLIEILATINLYYFVSECPRAAWFRVDQHLPLRHGVRGRRRWRQEQQQSMPENCRLYQRDFAATWNHGNRDGAVHNSRYNISRLNLIDWIFYSLSLQLLLLLMRLTLSPTTAWS